MSRHLRATGRWSGYYSSAVATVQQEGLVWPSGCGKDRKAEMLCFSAGVMPVDHWVVSRGSKELDRAMIQDFS